MHGDKGCQNCCFRSWLASDQFNRNNTLRIFSDDILAWDYGRIYEISAIDTDYYINSIIVCRSGNKSDNLWPLYVTWQESKPG